MRYIDHDINKRDFYLVACHEFDKQIEIVSTKNHNFKIIFPYAIEPDILNIFDVSVRLITDFKYEKNK